MPPVHATESLEIGLERYQPIAPAANANFTGVVINYFATPTVYLGTNQMALTVRRQSDYRPDFHLGILFPIAGNWSWETMLGVDFFTALLIALAILDEDENLDYKFSSDFYAPYFTFAAGLRYQWNSITFKILVQTQLGGYLKEELSAFNASLWLGLGFAYRLAL